MSSVAHSKHDETDPLWSTAPRALAARFGLRAIALIRSGHDVYETARLAASFALQCDPSLGAALTDGQTAAVLVAAIELNCGRFTRAEIGRSEWRDTQNSIWRHAVDAGVTADVIRQLAPSLTRGRS